VVADNGSTDQTVHIARGWKNRLPHLRVVDARERIGASAARNRGAEAAGGDVLAFCDADDEVTPGWLDALVRTLHTNDIAGGPLDIEALNGPSPVHATLHMQPKPPPALGFLPYVFSGNFAIRRTTFEQLGGFAEHYRNGEDVELSWRAYLDQRRVGWSTGAVVLYRLRTDRTAVARHMYRYGRASAQLFSDYRTRGMPRSVAPLVLRPWAWPVEWRPSPGNGTRGTRKDWVLRACWRAGHLAGSLRHHVRYL
jgi:glycosyltransferase involved in cell wall biosynthesis